MTLTKADRETAARKLFSKLASRERLRLLVEEARRSNPDPHQLEIERLRIYLREWRAYQQAYWPRLGTGSCSPWVSRATEEIHSASDYLERSDGWAMEVIERSVEDLRKKPDGEALRAALLVRLMNLAIPAQVFRHGRLAEISPGEVESLADLAEIELVGIVKAYGLPLA